MYLVVKVDSRIDCILPCFGEADIVEERRMLDIDNCVKPRRQIVCCVRVV